MLLKELFDKSVPYKIIAKTDTKFVTRAKIGDREINFGAYLRTSGPKNFDQWFIEFEELGDNQGHHLTGSGNEFEVLSMVKASIDEFVKLYNPSIMIFTADHEGGTSTHRRANVYERLFRDLKNYEIHRLRDNANSMDRFSIRRKINESEGITQDKLGTAFHFADGKKAFVKVGPKPRSSAFTGTICEIVTDDLNDKLLRPSIYKAESHAFLEHASMKRIEWIMANKLSHMMQTPNTMEFVTKFRMMFGEVIRDFE